MRTQQQQQPYHEGGRTRMPMSVFLLTLVNLLTLLMSIPILVVGIWLATRYHADCVSFLAAPLIVVGAVMLLVSLLGLWGALGRRALVLWMYLVMLTLLILLLLAFTIFAFVVSVGSKGHHVAGARFKEYRLEDYSPWMRHRVNAHQRWERVKRCLRRDGVCARMDDKYPNMNALYQSKLSYVESGCCKPPTSCCYHFVNATNWDNPLTPNADMDCNRWSNDPNQLCYDCNSCKAAVIRNLKKDWLKAAKVALAVLVVLVLLYFLAWIALLRALANKLLHPTTHSLPTRRP